MIIGKKEWNFIFNLSNLEDIVYNGIKRKYK